MPTIISQVLDETVAKITALALASSEVFKGRYQKAQHKPISINVYTGNIDDTSRQHTTGYSYFAIPVHVHIKYTRTDKQMGGTQIENLSGYMLQIYDALNLLRPVDLSQAITGFFLTKVQWDDTDTESGAGSSGAAAIDKTIDGYLTVIWEFWRANS